MSETEHKAHSGEHRHADVGPHAPREQRKPYWQRAHKDWKFWVGATAIGVAVVIYITTLDLSSVPWYR